MRQTISPSDWLTTWPWQRPHMAPVYTRGRPAAENGLAALPVHGQQPAALALRTVDR